MAAQLSTGRTARVCLAAALALALVGVAGCSGGSGAGSATSSTPVAAPKVIRGALPGLQVVAVSKLGKTDQRAIEMWQLAGESPDNLPTLKAGTYTPLVDGHVLEASEDTSSANGIAVSVITVHFDPEGTRLFTDATTANAGQKLALVLNWRVVLAPTVQDPITTGQIVINGSPEIVDLVANAIVPAK